MTVIVHGTCVLIGPRAVLLRGPSGSGKSDLAFRLIRGEGPSAMLVADDQVGLDVEEARLVASPPAALAGLLELRGLGLMPLPFARARKLYWWSILSHGRPFRASPSRDL